MTRPWSIALAAGALALAGASGASLALVTRRGETVETLTRQLSAFGAEIGTLRAKLAKIDGRRS